MCSDYRSTVVESFEDIVAVTKVFAKGKTTIPEEVRKLFGRQEGDNVIWYRKGGSVCLKKRVRTSQVSERVNYSSQ